MTAPPRVPTILQFQAAECALAALAMVMAHHGCAVPLDEVRQRAGVSSDGTSLAVLKAVAASYGFATRAFRKEPEAVAALGFPCLAFVSFNHMLVIEAMTPTALIVVDPVGGRQRLSAAEFERIFTGIVIRLEPTAAMAPRRRVKRRSVPALIRQNWGWAGLVLILAMIMGGAETILALALETGDVVTPLLAAAALRLGLHGALEGWAKGLRQGTAALVDRLLPSRAASYFGLRNPSMLASTAHVPRHLSEVIQGGPAAASAGLVAALPPLALLAFMAPPTAAAAAAAWAICAVATAHTFLAAGSPWRRMRQHGGPLPLGYHFLTPEPWQMSGREDEALSEAVAADTRAISPSGDFAIADSRLRAIIAAAIAATAAIAMATAPGLTPAVLAVLACWPWLHVPKAMPALFSLRDLAAMLDDLTGAPAVPPSPAAAAPGIALAGRGLAFAHGPVLLFRDLECAIAVGARIGLTGPAGAGKTTLARVLAGQMAPRAGNVASSGAVTLVAAAPALFAASIADNVACWRPGMDQQRIEAALRAAELWDEISGRADGIATHVAEDAANLSGGQRRRLMLARALAGAPSVVILDECLDAVDVATEARILQNLRDLGMTVLLISQRRESLSACDAVWRLSEGVWRPWHDGADAHAAIPATPGAGAAPPPDPPPPAPPDAATWAALVTAAALLGQDLPACCPPVSSPPGVRPLDWLARQHGLLLFPVSLHDHGWHRRGDGVILARQPDKGPVVLAPSGLGGYRQRTPQGRWRRLTNAGAATLATDALLVLRRPDNVTGAALAWSSWQIAAATLVLWLGVLALVCGGTAIAAVAAVGIGMGALTLARHRLRDRLRLIGTVAAAGHALRLSPWWSRSLPSGRLERWCEDFRTRSGRRDTALAEAAALTLVVTGMILLLPRPEWTAAMAATAAATVLILGRLGDRRQRQARKSKGAANVFLSPLLELLPWCPGSQSAAAAYGQWRRREDDSERDDRRLRLIVTLRRCWLLLSPLAGLAIAASAPPSVILSCALSMVIGNGLGMALDSLIGLRRRRFKDILAAPRECGGARPSRPPHALTADAVSFGYDRPLLRHLSLAIKPGEIVAIAGPSGCGKSTLMRLLMGFEPPQSGRVLMDGIDMATADRLEWRAHAAAVFQDERLDFSPLHAQVRGSAPLGLDQVAARLIQIGLWPKVAALPMGLATLVDCRFLSGGQAAQLMLARALSRQPSLLFLDETLAAMDPAARAQALAAIRASGATCVLTSHQSDVLAAADRVLWLEDGAVRAETGTPPPPLASHAPLAVIPADPPSAFGSATRLYRPAALARIEGPDRRDVLPSPPPSPLLPLCAALIAVVLAWLP
ncbi:ATP-binding cassette domain-containing protein [Magnetospirillum sulfuroxidans]|uniref:ATP-binding cassette domain-containing protein n=1 Tax=Magnetospirillum sulfuroxidans TaxID=611300 RepID=A0ABS5IDX1_9PROT|nr:ATP-binding cassette domain-containing protein [Magnetospirillum sulfuroxidans]MBR9972544.1 ATP-binding cassette domain-containing protein [Magnetospirillum sulfuroxidans]